MELNYIAPINSLGYGVVALNLFLALRKQGVDIKLWPIGPIDCYTNYLSFLYEAIDSRHQYDKGAPCIKVWHQHDLAQQVGTGCHVGYPIFELDKFTQDEQGEMMGMDMLLSCSHWAKDIILDNCHISDDSVHVIPCGVDRQTFHENIGVSDPNWTTFLNIGKWEYRKGHDIIAEAFEKAFTPKDRVRLWMMNHNPFISEKQTKEWEALYKTTSMGHRVSFLPRVQSHAEVAKVMSEADCGVFPSRAEGWNLELLEMMSMGKQVIATDYSAHTEFCTPYNCHLIHIYDLEPAYDGVFFGDDTVGRWAKLGEVQVDELARYMRAVHANRKTNMDGVATAKAFSWEAAAQRIIEIDELWG